MGLRFFGLTPEYRKQLFRQLHEIVFHGKGYNWWDVYNMPIWLRNHTFLLIKQHYEKLKEQEEDAVNKARNIQKVSLPKPGLPFKESTYTTSLPKK